MQALTALFGTMHDITPAQECARAVLIFVYGLAMLRLSGRRTFAQWSALDIVISIIAGSALSRALTASVPLPGTLAAVAVLVLLHVIFSHAVARSEMLSRWIEGAALTLARNGVLDDDARRRHKVSRADLAEALRAAGIDGIGALDRTGSVTLEPSGKITVVPRK